MHIKSLTHKKLATTLLALLVLDGYFYGSLNSTKVAPFVLIIGLVILATNIYTLFYGVISLIRLYGIPIKKKKRVSLYATLFLGLLIALQSMGALSAKDFIVMVLLAVVGYGYVSHTGMTKQKEQNL